MKRILLSAAFLVAGFGVNAQDLSTQKFDDLTVGDLTTDLTGKTAGQGDWYTYAESGTTADFQVVNLGGTDNGLLLTSTNQVTSSVATVKYAEQFLDLSWPNRDAGNDFILFSYELFTGTATANAKAVLNARLYNLSGQTIAGFTYNNVTREIAPQIFLNNATGGTKTATYYFKEPVAPATNSTALILDENTWYTMVCMFDKTTGDVYFTCNHPDVNAFKIAGGTADNTGYNKGKDPLKLSFYTFGAAGNTTSEEFVIDNVRIRAQADTNLSVNSPVKADSFSVSPNPANNYVNISGGNVTFDGVSITDLNGRVVKNVKFDAVSTTQVNVSELSAGMYIMNIHTNEGATITKKIVKN